MSETLVKAVGSRTPILSKQPIFDSSALVEQYGDYLFSFAVSRVRDVSVAEDLVQETLLAALEKLNTFSNKSSIRTWLTSILKNKIFDYFRKSSREELFDCNDDAYEAYFQPDGSWKPQYSPSSWNENPDTVVENQEFWKIINKGLLALPKKTAEAFVLHEIEGLSSEDVCSMLHISRNNLWIMLHRARLFMRNEIEVNFFTTKGK